MCRFWFLFFFCHIIVEMRSRSCWGEEGTEETRFFFAAAVAGRLEAGGKQGRL